MGKLVTTTELAEILGVSRVTLAKAAKDGRVSVAERDARGRPLFDSKIAVKEWGEWSELSARKSRHHEGKPTGGKQASVNTAEIEDSLAQDGVNVNALFGNIEQLTDAQKLTRADFVKRVWEGRLKEKLFREKEGTLISMDSVREQGAELGVILINGLRALPARLSAQLAASSDVHEISELLMAEINQLVERVRDAIQMKVVEFEPQSEKAEP